MPIAAVCPSCSAKLKMPDGTAGRRGKCPRCNGYFEVPGESAAETVEYQPEPVTPEPATLRVGCASCKSQLTLPMSAIGKLAQCPTCGTTFTVKRAERPEEPAPERERSWIERNIGRLLVWGIILLVAVAAAVSQRNKDGDDDDGDRAMIAVARTLVKGHLVAPSTAVFPLMDDPSYRVFRGADGTVEVSGLVEAKNKFGVLLSQRFTIKMRRLGGDTWTTINVSLK